MKNIYINTLLIFFIAFPTNLKSDYKSNPILSIGLSALIPGTGQILNGDYKKGLFFLGVELLALNQKSKYNKKGKYFIQQYENYAMDYWSVEKWLKDFYLYKNPDYEIYSAFVNSGPDLQYCNSNGEYCDDDDYFDFWDYSHGVDFIFNNQLYSYKEIGGAYEDVCGNEMEYGGSCELYILNPGQDPELIDSYLVRWAELEIDDNGNVVLDENDLPVLNFSGLEAVRDYHFHEGIGKYPEFFSGWIDATLENSTLEIRNGYRVPITENKSTYQNLRNNSNKEFDKEELMLSVLFLNHAFSIFDIFLSSINSMPKIDVNSNVKYDQNLKPTGINLSLKW